MRGLRILFISQYFPPDITAASFRVAETAAWLERMGWSVVVLTATPHRARAESGTAEPNARIRIVRAPILPIGDRGGLWYVLHYLSFMLTSLLWGALRAPWKADIVLASSPPLFVGVSGWILSKLKRGQFVLDVRDLWPDSAAAVGQLSRSGLLARAGRRLERFLYSRAVQVICVSRPMREAIISRSDPEKDVVVVYNAVDTELVGGVRKQEPKPEAELQTIAYVGNVGRAQGLEILMAAAERFPDVEFRIIGGGVCRAALESLASEQHLANVSFFGPVPKSEALAHMRASSALFLHVLDDPVFATTIPSKLFDYLLADRPILYGIRGEGAQLLDSLPGNVRFLQGNSDSLIEAIERLRTSYTACRGAARTNSKSLAQFDRAMLTRRLAEALERLVG
jgi:glycosyltransferase involved in cell wall biosynthesis